MSFKRSKMFEIHAFFFFRIYRFWNLFRDPLYFLRIHSLISRIWVSHRHSWHSQKTMHSTAVLLSLQGRDHHNCADGSLVSLLLPVPHPCCQGSYPVVCWSCRASGCLHQLWNPLRIHWQKPQHDWKPVQFILFYTERQVKETYRV